MDAWPQKRSLQTVSSGRVGLHPHLNWGEKNTITILIMITFAITAAFIVAIVITRSICCSA